MEKEMILKILEKIDKIDGNISELTTTCATLKITSQSTNDKIFSVNERVTELENQKHKMRSWAMTAILGSFLSAIILTFVKKNF